MTIENELFHIATDKLDEGSNAWETVLCVKDMVVEVRKALTFYEGLGDATVPASAVVAKLKRIMGTVE
mgnify:CR=1 FL=1